MEKTRLLIVDDEEDDLNIMSHILKKDVDECYVAKSGQEAFSIIAEKKINIVLVDILMPNMTGFEVCKEIRRSYIEWPLQIVVISGLTNDHFLEQAIEVGGDDFITKPIVALELKRRIKVATIRLKSQLKMHNEAITLKETVAQKDKLYEELSSTNEELKVMANFDTLTGLMNRASLFSTIDNELARSQRTGAPLTGIMLDLDHFKRVNDNYGHQTGDCILTKLGTRLKKYLRRYDYAGRYGGEEFYIVLTNASLQQGFVIGERFREHLDKNDFLCEDKKIKVTVSMGIAQYRENESRDDWIARADKALYHAKENGRNRICLE
ncbi:MAG: diguanylate cyclase [Spirochaetales bacterium]|nr:diguanylate cyclase [Spirochaetales bacterium]